MFQIQFPNFYNKIQFPNIYNQFPNFNNGKRKNISGGFDVENNKKIFIGCKDVVHTNEYRDDFVMTISFCNSLSHDNLYDIYKECFPDSTNTIIYYYFKDNVYYIYDS